jgi:hypothetical protein
MKSSASGIPTILSSLKRLKANSVPRSVLITILAALGVGLLAVSSDSLWIDEGLSAVKAVTPSPEAAWQELRTEANTNMHMLLYMAALWAWEKFSGPSEWALRSMNIPFFVLGVTALWLAIPRAARPFLLAFCLLSPFLWFYLNEARTYSMIFGFSAVTTAELLDWLDHGKEPVFAWARWSWILALSLAALIWTHVVGLVFEFAVAVFIFAHLGWRGLGPFLRKTWIPIFFLTAANLALLGYVLWTKAQGVEANPIGKTTWLGLVYWLYEFGGFTGLGPNRNDLRTNPLASLRAHLLPLALLGLTWLAVLLGSWKRLSLSRRQPATSVAIFLVLVPLLTFLAIGVWQGVRFLPRYAASTYPAFAVLASFLLCSLWSEGGWRRWAGLLLLVGLASSSLNLRLNPAHAKDDYRGVVQWLLAQKLPPETIWWAADTSTARYYGMPGVTAVINPTASDLAERSQPTRVVLSKPDIYDIHAALREWIARRGGQLETTFPSFQIYRFPESQSP